MKYYSELSNIESQIIRLDTMRSLFTVLSNGAELSNSEDVRNALYYIEGSLHDIHATLRDEFDELWDAVSEEDEPKEKHKGGMKKKKMMTDKELP